MNDATALDFGNTAKASRPDAEHIEDSGFPPEQRPVVSGAQQLI
jgi:hypothetical protein